MVEAELAGEWRELVARAGGDEARTVQALESDGRTREQLFDEWRPRVERRLKLMLLVDKLADEEKIEVSDEDLDAELEKRAKERNTDAASLKQQYEQANMLRMLRTDVRNERLNLAAGFLQNFSLSSLDLVQPTRTNCYPHTFCRQRLGASKSNSPARAC